MKERLAHLDRIAGQLNALLVVLAIGLGVLDLTVLVGKGMMSAIAANMPQVTVVDDDGVQSAPAEPAAPASSHH